MGVVLVVEDDPINAVLAQTVLRRDGHTVLTTGEGTAALDIVRRRLPDLVLLDVSLAGAMTGLDVCRAMRADPALTQIPVLVLSGWTFESDVIAAYEAGADGYVAKPFTAAELQTRAQDLIDRSASRTSGGNDPPRGTPVQP